MKHIYTWLHGETENKKSHLCSHCAGLLISCPRISFACVMVIGWVPFVGDSNNFWDARKLFSGRFMAQEHCAMGFPAAFINPKIALLQPNAIWPR